MKKFFYIPITHNANCSLGLFFVQFLSKEIYNYYNKNPFYNLGISHWKQIPKLNSKLESDFFFNQPKGYDICEKILKEKETFKFLFCRNPWDRLVSCFYSRINLIKYLIKNKNFILSNTFFSESQIDLMEFYAKKNLNSFDDFIDNLDKPSIFVYERQYDYVNDNLDFVGRYENIDKDLDKVKIHLNLKTNKTLPKIHVNKNRSKDYRFYYKDKSKDYVKDFFNLDIEYFGYEY